MVEDLAFASNRHDYELILQAQLALAPDDAARAAAQAQLNRFYDQWAAFDADPEAHIPVVHTNNVDEAFHAADSAAA